MQVRAGLWSVQQAFGHASAAVGGEQEGGMQQAGAAAGQAQGVP
jgi:hypothetical protein